MTPGPPPLLVLLPPLMGVVGAIAIHHLWLWAGRRADRVPLWVAAWCGATLLFLGGHHLQLGGTSPNHVLLGAQAAWSGGLLTVPVLMGLLHALNGRPALGRAVWPLAGVSVAFILLMLATELVLQGTTDVRTDVFGYRYPAPRPGPLLPAVAAYVLGVFAFGWWQDRRPSSLMTPREHRALRLGFTLYALAGFHDILNATRVIHSTPLFDYAFVAGALGLTYLLTQRYNRLQSHLEDVVAARTSELQRGQTYLAALVRAGRNLMTGLDLQPTLQRIIEEATRITGSPHVKVLLVDRAAGVLRMGAVAGGSVPPDFAVPLGTSYSGTIATTGEPLFVADTQNDPRNLLAQRDRDEGIRTFLGLPIRKGDEVLGVLTVNTAEPHDYTPAELEALGSFADQAALAIENARLYAAVTDREKRLGALATLTQSLTSTLSLDEVMGRVVEDAVALFGSSAAGLWLVDESGETVTLRAEAGARVTPRAGTTMRLDGSLVGRVVVTRAPLVVEDMETAEGRNQALQQAEQLKSLLAVPLVFGPRVLGALGIAVRERRRFSPEDVRLLEALASHAAVGIHNAGLFEEAEARRRRLAAMVDVSRRMSAQLALPTVLTSISAAAAEIFGGEAAVRVVEGEWLVRVSATAGALAAMPRERIRIGESASGMVAATGEPYFSVDTGQDTNIIADHRAHTSAERTGSLMCLPIRMGTQILGTLNVYAARGHRFDKDAIALATSLAEQAAVAIENARLYEASRSQTDELLALHEVSTALVSTLDMGAVLDTLVAAAVKLIGCQSATVFQFDPRDGLLHPRLPATAAPYPVPLVRPGQGAAGGAYARRQPVWNADMRQDLPGYRDEAANTGRSFGELIRSQGFRAALGVPVEIRDRAIGSIVVRWSEPHTPSEHEIELLGSFARQAAVALENASLYAALEERFRRLETLSRLNQLISASLDRDRVLSEIAGAAAQLTGAAVATFWLANEADRSLELITMSDRAMLESFPSRRMGFDEGLIGWIASRRERVDLPDMSADPRLVVSDWLRAHGLTSFYGVPVVIEGALIGVLCLIGRGPIRIESDEEHRLLESFVAQAAVAVRNASLYAAEGQARREAELALSQVKHLHGLLPICAYCKRVRNDRNYWEQIETYIGERSQASFSHGICPDCRATVVQRELDRWKEEREERR